MDYKQSKKEQLKKIGIETFWVGSVFYLKRGIVFPLKLKYGFEKYVLMEYDDLVKDLDKKFWELEQERHSKLPSLVEYDDDDYNRYDMGGGWSSNQKNNLEGKYYTNSTLSNVEDISEKKRKIKEILKSKGFYI